MSKPKPKDLSHTARCLDCGAWNEYPGGVIGTPLVIRHAPDCPSKPRPCDVEFGEHEHDDVECARILHDMSPDPFDPMDDIPWGTPDSWIPDNPNEDGFTQSDFI